MQLSFTQKKNIRKSFGKLAETLSIPNLIEVQKNSYKQLTDFDLEAGDLSKGFDRSEVTPNPKFAMKESLSSKVSKVLNEEYKRRNFIK